jgi:hypothetical protein
VKDATGSGAVWFVDLEFTRSHSYY